MNSFAGATARQLRDDDGIALGSTRALATAQDISL
jgi:hypothetical protein